jgi:pimeloyl-ACP methyl ester carboxylesterase
VLINLAGGRVLEVALAGPESGLPLVVHHGTPGAAVPFQPMVDAAVRHGLRAVHYSRPGYGASSPDPGRTVANAAADTAAVLDALGADRFVTLGYSGGGPHALACAALLPERCLATACVAGVAPYSAEGLDWTAGMGAENIDEFGAAVEGAAALRAFLLAQAPGLAHAQGPELAAALGDLVSPVDRGQLTGEFADFLAASFRHAVSQGIDGWQDDDLAFMRGWGFPLAQARRVTIWQGGQDRMVPFAHGEWLAARIPGATARLRAEDGHLSLLVGAIEDIIADLTDRV